MKQKEYGKAIEYYQHAIETSLLNEQKSNCFFNIGECYLNLVFIIIIIYFTEK